MPSCKQRAAASSLLVGVLLLVCCLAEARAQPNAYYGPPVAPLAAQEEVPAPIGQPAPGLLSPEALATPLEGFPSLSCETCGTGPCVPGRSCCQACEGKTHVGRFFCAIYQSICCPDPCYEPHWLALADASFFVPAARPQNQQRVRWDAGLSLVFPDRAEYFWARADGSGLGPRPTAPLLGELGVDYHEMSLYTEAAHGNFGMFVEIPYRSIDPVAAPQAAGFGDMIVGTKSLLFDRELMQIAFQFRTIIPQGDSTRGLGTGHVSLEPSLLMALNLAPRTYLQAQVAEWIPLGGNPDYAGAILHYHFSFNHVVYQFLPDVPLIGTLEFNGWSFQTGAYTDPFLGGLQRAGDQTYTSFGPGLRLVICDKLDFGVGAAFAPSDERFAEQLFRTEFRWRF